MEVSPVAAGGGAFLVAGILVPLLVRFAVGKNLLDVPNIRSSHEVPTPRLGGAAILAGTWIGFMPMHPERAWPLLAAATFMWTVGLADDLSNLGFKAKAFAQTVLAAALIFLYPPEVLLGAPGTALKAIVFGVGVVWIVALCNAFNFMDGIDGITGGVAAINAFFLAAVGGASEAFLLPLIGAILGFLIWNISPASIFCGDSGSYFLGFTLALISLYAPVPGNGWTPSLFIACALVFTPYLFDTAYTLVRRLVARENVFSAHREHIYQRITPTTAMHRRTSNLYYAASVFAGFSAMLLASGGALMIAGAILALGLCMGLAALPCLIGDEEKEPKGR